MSVASPAASAALSAAFITASDGVATGLSVSYSSLHFLLQTAQGRTFHPCPSTYRRPCPGLLGTCLQSQEVARAAPGASPHRASRPFRVFQLVPLVAPHAAHVVLGRAGSAASPSRRRIALVAVWTWGCDKGSWTSQATRVGTQQNTSNQLDSKRGAEHVDRKLLLLAVVVVVVIVVVVAVVVVVVVVLGCLVAWFVCLFVSL